MSAEDSPTRFVVFCGEDNELPRYWSDTKEGAERLRTDGWKLMYASGESEGDPVKLLDPDKFCIREIEVKKLEKNPLKCPWHSEEYRFYDDGYRVGCPDGGWVGCPKCGRR